MENDNSTVLTNGIKRQFALNNPSIIVQARVNAFELFIDKVILIRDLQEPQAVHNPQNHQKSFDKTSELKSYCSAIFNNSFSVSSLL